MTENIQIQLLDIDMLLSDTTTMARVEIDSDTVEQYARDMMRGDVFPLAIAFTDGKKYWLADGWHLAHAAKRNGATAIHCVVNQGGQRDALWHALGANRNHGYEPHQLN